MQKFFLTFVSWIEDAIWQASNSVHYGQWLWFEWQGGRSKTRDLQFESIKRFILCQLYWKDDKKGKRCDIWSVKILRNLDQKFELKSFRSIELSLATVIASNARIAACNSIFKNVPSTHFLKWTLGRFTQWQCDQMIILFCLIFGNYNNQNLPNIKNWPKYDPNFSKS